MHIDRLDHLVMTVANIEKTRKRGKGERGKGKENAGGEKSLVRYVIKINPKSKK
uniref:hypothetical protein n=1 Tax=Hassallia byssoidea TaxID=482630 RepID=UPI0013D1BA04|nr:hypothetical protein [Hassalia byssoidea]